MFHPSLWKVLYARDGEFSTDTINVECKVICVCGVSSCHCSFIKIVMLKLYIDGGIRDENHQNLYLNFAEFGKFCAIR